MSVTSTAFLYLDANATEPLRPEARRAAIAALDVLGNPSSVHAAGRAARRVLEDARESLAARFGAEPSEVALTAGGTEANALAVAGLGRGRRVLVGATEHAAVLGAAPPEAERVPVRPDGTANLDALAAMLAAGAGAPALVCLMAANNETGVLHPLAEASALCRGHGALLHVDAVQAAGRVALDPGIADSMALSGHKLGGPAGAGTLVLRPGLHLPALIAGGGQERGRRGGTEPLVAIAGFAAAAAAAGSAAETERLARLRDRLEAAVATGAPEAAILGAGAPRRLPNTSCILLPGVPAESQVIALDLAGVRVSAGAACSSGKVARSHVLAAMGLGEAAAGCAIRVSLPWNAAEDAPERFVAAWSAMRARLSRRAA
jgi:cysteine desulfurase